jgi:branched-chain amino acid:cation transporter, LIVCS family
MIIDNRGTKMNSKQLTRKEIFVIGLMLFALFLGAGNMIFPPSLGQAAGTNVWTAIIGFLFTGVGLPLLGVTAIALSGSDLQKLASRVHPMFGILFTIVMYLAIGPLFGIPRTGTVAYEIGVTPFLPASISQNGWLLLIYTVIFFGITYWLSLNPSKLVDRIGKLLTPILLTVLALIAVKAVLTPMGQFQAPLEAYKDGAFFKGFIDGYLTMDTIAALVFGIVVISSIQDKGVTDKTELTKVCIKAGIIAASGLALVYISLAYLGATSVEAIGYTDNGSAILSGAASFLFGSAGKGVLALAITFACLTTSVGLVSSCAAYFSKILPNVSYSTIVKVLSLFSMIIANIGLTQLIHISLPILIMIYPLAIVLIILSFIHPIIKGHPEVYAGSMIATGIISLHDGLAYLGIHFPAITNLLISILPLFKQGIGWLLPAMVGGLVGWFLSYFRRTKANVLSSH